MHHLASYLTTPEAAEYVKCLEQYCPDHAKLVKRVQELAAKGDNADRAVLVQAMIDMYSDPEIFRCQFRRCVRTFEGVYMAYIKQTKAELQKLLADLKTASAVSKPAAAAKKPAAASAKKSKLYWGGRRSRRSRKSRRSSRRRSSRR